MGQCLQNCFSNPKDDDDQRSKLTSTNQISLKQAKQSENNIFYSSHESVFKTALEIKNDEINISDFQLLKTIGRGSYGKVLLVKKKSNNAYYAMKIVSKVNLKVDKQQEYAKTERWILENVKHPFLAKLHYAFQTKQKLYYVMDFCQGGELFFHLRRAYKFSEEQARFYAAELVSVISHLHNQQIIYRDLKPENVLINSDGHIKLIDFGLSKIVQRTALSYSIVGTPEYLAPEVYQDIGHDERCDWWSLGALIYEMLTGAAPDYNPDKTLMLRNRLEKPIDMKPWFSEECKSLLNGLLNNDPSHRITSQEIMNHPFFREIDWNNLNMIPPIIPKFKGRGDLQCFNKMFVDEPATDSPQKEVEMEFDNFTFNEDK